MKAIPLCPALVDDKPHLADLPCAEHAIEDMWQGHALWGNVYYRCPEPGHYTIPLTPPGGEA